ncbi:MAG: alginate export family protein [Syntrophaceae bacterium]|nr:alginate export family protein [Syntrophaceae bacterium]
MRCEIRRWLKPILMTAFLLISNVFFTTQVVLAAASDKDKPPVEQASKEYYSLKNGGWYLYRSEDGKTMLTLGGIVMGRYAYWNWFEGPSDHNSYHCGFVRTRLDLKFSSKYMDIYVQPQYVHMFGIPDDATAPSPRGPCGMGALYCLHNDHHNPYEFGFHQLYLQFQNLFVQDIKLKGGRFEYSDGLEVFREIDGAKFNTVKKMRLADRIISPFGWSAFGRSFDGGLISYDNDYINVTSSFFFPTQGGWEKDMNDTMEDIKMTTATLTVKRDAVIPGAQVAAFYYNYNDNRDVIQRVDNTAMIAPYGVDINVHMFGGHLLGVYDFGPGQGDILFWGGGQFGDWYELDHQAYAFDTEIGYQFTKLPLKPWLRAGYFRSSGDDDGKDGNHETFFQMAPGTRKYELLPFYDLMNSQDLFFQFIVKPIKKATLRTEYHIIRLTEDNDRWYMGSGPTQERGAIFGYLARPTHEENNLAQELDVILQTALHPHCDLILSYSHIFGKDVIEEIYEKDNHADYFSVELQVKF